MDLRMGAVGDALVGFRLDERTRAVVPLRTGQLFENVRAATLEQRLAAHRARACWCQATSASGAGRAAAAPAPVAQ
jgi:hypothetical protein